MEPIQSMGFSTGNLPAMELAWYANLTYKDPQYAVNRVTLLDAVCTNLTQKATEYQANPVGGEQCWVDNYISNQAGFMAATIPGTLNVTCIPARPHSYPQQRYMQAKFDYENHGVTAFGYLSLAGKGKNYQLNTESNRYFFQIDKTLSLVMYNLAMYPGKILAPVTLSGPGDGNTVDANGAMFGCGPCENAVRYQLLMGPDQYTMNHVIWESNEVPQVRISTFPYETTYWTVKAFDQFGSSIYADPICVKAEKTARPILNSTCKEFLSCTGYDTVWQKRISRTVFEYCFRIRVKNHSYVEAEKVTLDLNPVPDNAAILNNKVFFKVIAGQQEAVSDNTFIVRIDRNCPFDGNEIAWQRSCNAEGDFSADGKLDFADLSAIADEWLKTGEGLAGDLYHDEIINFVDFTIFAQEWLNNN
jgi:hypothetical protein